MKIGLFTDAYKPQISGVTTSVQMLRNELIKRGHEVFVVTTTVNDYDVSNEVGIIRLPSIPFKKLKDLRIGIPVSPSQTSFIKNLNLDIIHTHTEFSMGLYGKYFAKRLGIPLVHTYHTMYEEYTHYVYTLRPGRELIKSVVKRIMKNYIEDCNKVIAPTKKTKLALLSYGVENDICILPTGVDVNHFKRLPKDDKRLDNIREKYGIKITDYVLLFLGRVAEEKSIDVILRAFAGVRERKDNVKMLIVGDGPAMKKLKYYAEDLGIDDITHFVGLVPHEEVQYYYSVADLFVNASRTETQGLTIMEAMASMLPIIVFDDDNIEEIVEDEFSGRLFTDDEQFEGKIIDAMENKEKTFEYAKNALDKMQELSKEEFAKGAEKIYESAVRDYNADKE